MKARKNLIHRFFCSEVGDGSAEYGTVMAFSTITVAFLITIFNATQSGLIATLADDSVSRLHFVAAKSSGSLN